MSEILQERPCGKATMYVITEKGLETGPFVYGKETGSRVLCTNTGHIYYSQQKESRRIDTVNSSGAQRAQERKLRIVDLGNCLPTSDTLAVGSLGKQAVRDMDIGGAVVGDFRVSHAIRRSGKQRTNKEKIEYELADNSKLPLEKLKQVFDNSVRDGKKKKVFSDKIEQSLIESRQTKLRKLQLKRKSKMLMEEVDKWRDNTSMNKKVDSKAELESKEQDQKTVKEMCYPIELKTTNGQNVLPRLNLLCLTRMSTTEHSKKRPTKKDKSGIDNISTNNSLNCKLIFLNPNSIYSQVRAETTAKLNINESKATLVKPRVRFPSVIDQRTGEMHSVPGAVTYRKCDYNQWSRKRNIVRRNISHSRSPIVTYVSVFPSIPEKKNY